MSATERLFFGEAEHDEIIANFGLIPTSETIRRVTKRLHKFGELGIKGFDMSISAFAILRGDEEHRIIHKNVNGTLEEFKKPFTFMTPNESDCSDHGLYEGFTYGLNILSRTLPGVRFNGYEAKESVEVLVEDTLSGNVMIAHSTDNLSKSPIEFGYEEKPSNVDVVFGYLVLPKPEAKILLANSCPVTAV